MNEKLRKFLEANGLRTDATESDAWDLLKKLQGRGVPVPTGIPKEDLDPPTTTSNRNEPTTTKKPAGTVETSQKPGSVTGQSEGSRGEIDRIELVRSYADNFGVDIAPEWISDTSYEGEKLRAAVAKKYSESHEPLGNSGGNGSGAGVGDDPVAKIRGPIMHGLMMRAGYNPIQLNDRGEPEKAPLEKGWQRFQRMSLARMALEYATAQGIKGVRQATDEEICRAMLSGETRMQRNEPMSFRGPGAVTSDDFPNLINNVVNQVVESYTLQQIREWLPAVRVVQMNDFRTRFHKRVKADALLGEGSNIDKWPIMQFEDSGESWKISPRGIKLIVTLDAMLGDDFNVLTEGPLHMMRGMFATERFMFYDFLVSAVAMSDGKSLFHVDHGNLATVDITRGDLSTVEDALFAAEQRMAEQKYTVKGNDIGYLNAQIKTVFHSTKDNREFSKLTLNRQLSNTEEPNGYNNKWYGQETVSRPEVGDQMICVADPNEFPCIEAGWLFGDQSLRMGSQTSYTGWQTETVGWTAFGMGRVGFVGIDKTVVTEGA